jgi:Ca2+-binding RTX toxin-like protein
MGVAMRVVRPLMLVFVAAAWIAVGLPALAGGPPPPGPNVTINTDSAEIDTFQALGFDPTQSRDRSRDDFVGFSENLLPPALTNSVGTAKAFASQASTMITPSSDPFPTGPLNGIGISGRARSVATKNNKSNPGVPVSDSEGSLDVDFSTSGPTPFQLAGAMVVSDDPAEDCGDASVELSGPIHLFFFASQGEFSGSSPDCEHPDQPSKGFQVNDVLPAGDYTLSVRYEAQSDPEVPGTQVATAKVEVSMLFFHKCSIVGNSGPNTLNGTPGDDIICGSGGNDTINGLGGNDEVFGGTGDDTISGAGGADLLRGEGGNDTITAGPGEDRILGGSGNDQASGGGGKDTARGEEGADTLTGLTGDDLLDGGPGKDDLDGGQDADVLKAKDGTRDDVDGGTGQDEGFVDHVDVVNRVEVIHH